MTHRAGGLEEAMIARKRQYAVTHRAGGLEDTVYASVWMTIVTHRAGGLEEFIQGFSEHNQVTHRAGGLEDMATRTRQYVAPRTRKVLSKKAMHRFLNRYIVVFYNSLRPHSKLVNLSPNLLPNAFKRESTSKTYLITRN